MAEDVYPKLTLDVVQARRSLAPDIEKAFFDFGAIRLGCGWWSGLIRNNGLADA